MIPIRKFSSGLIGQKGPGRVIGKENPIMAKLNLRGASAAKGTGKGKSGAKAARKSSGGRRARKTLGGESGARKGSSGADTSFDFGGSSF